jgi:hypothetical protein
VDTNAGVKRESVLNGQMLDDPESARAEWEVLGRPERQQLGLTVQQDGRHALWCGEPGNGVAELDG